MFFKKSSDQSSGRIPKELRPKIEADPSRIKDDQNNQNMLRATFEYSNTKFVVSGKSMAAYHPSIKSEMCPECCGKRDQPGGETDPGKDRIGVAFGSALPKGIREEAQAGLEKDPTKFFAAMQKDFVQFQRTYMQSQN